MSDFASFHLGLIGWPLGHSLSPLIHNAAIQALGLQADYRLYPVPPLPEGNNQLRELLKQVRSGELSGLNVTIPHKQNVLPWLERLTPLAQAVGAVNTIYRQDNLLVGDNTDVAGFTIDLHKNLTQNGIGSPVQALVLGAGGAARAVVYSLLQSGSDVTIAARRVEQAQDLALSLQSSTGKRAEFFPLNASSFTRWLKASPPVLIVNATSVGMFPHDLDSPWPAGIPLPAGAAVYDLVYQPLITTLVQNARMRGLPAVTGLGMLVEQAACAFERWTGVNAPREVMFAAAIDFVSQQKENK